MSTDFLPRRNADLLAWAQRASTYITANAVLLGLTPAMATQLATLLAAFAAALSASENPATDSRTASINLATTKATLIAEIRALVRIIQANPAVTPQMKSDLDITIRDQVKTPISAPTTKPVVSQRAIDSRSLTVLIVDEATPLKKAKPFGVDGAEIWAWVAPTAGAGAQPPADLTDWRFIAVAKRSQYTVSFRAEDAGKQAYVCAKWLGSRGETGPTSAQLVTTVVA